MKKILSFIALSVFGSAMLLAESYEVDVGHSSIGFNVKHMSISNVKGSFSKFKGTIELDGKTIKALNGEVEISSVDTNSKGRDSHLQKDDFFDAKKFAKATIELVKHSGKKLEANVTIRGITKKITFNAELNGPVAHPMKKGKQAIALNLEGKLNRKDFGVGTDTANAMVSDNVDINIAIEAISK